MVIEEEEKVKTRAQLKAQQTVQEKAQLIFPQPTLLEGHFFSLEEKTNNHNYSNNNKNKNNNKNSNNGEDESLREQATSPFSKLQNDLELLVSELDADINPNTGTMFEAKIPRINNFIFPLVVVAGGEGGGGGGASTNSVSGGKNRGETLLSIPPRRPSSNTNETLINESIVTRSLWIGNLDPTISENELRVAFEPFGAIESLRLLPTKECAFVNYFNVEDALVARENLQGAALGNMIIRIGYGKADGSHAGGGGVGNGVAPGLPANFNENFKQLQVNNSQGESMTSQSRSVWVGHIGPDVDVELLCTAFSQFGQIESCRILDAKNCAFVNFFNSEDASRARKALNGVRIGSSLIKTGFAKSSNGTIGGGGGKGEVELLTLAKKFSSSLEVKVVSDDANISMSTLEVSEDDFRQTIPSLPIALQLPEELNSSIIRECRRRVEHSTVSPEEIDYFSQQVMNYMLAASVDPVGNILVQKLIERGSDETRSQILDQLGIYISTVGIHKNGTWVIQKLINNCRTLEQRQTLAERIKPHIVPLLQDQFGNYVVQCCLTYGPPTNQFIFDALYHRCVDIATCRFGSRAMRSCLESPHVSKRQMKFVAMALISHALTLVHDPNGVIVIQWFLDSDLPGRHAFITPVLKGHFANLCQSKHASSIVAKLIHPSADASARESVIDELFYSSTLPSLLQEPMSAAIILRCLMTARPEQKIRLAHLLEPQISKFAFMNLPHLQKIEEEVQAAFSMVQLEPEKSTDSLQRAFSSAPTLLSHAVGGPVSNSTIFRSLNGSNNGNRPMMIDAFPLLPSSSSSSLNRTMSFGAVNTILPATPEPLYQKQSFDDNDRLSFGPALLQRLDVLVGRPPTPS